MALTLVPFPASAPTSITDWEDIINVAEFNTLGVQGTSMFNFSSNTIKQGTRIMIGGSVYLADADTTITGTPSDYVKITPSGATASAAYVSSLTGVSWNSVWNFWEDISGNAYLFNEMKNYAGGGSAPRSALAQHYSYGAYDKLVSLEDTILARDSGQVLIGTSTPSASKLYVLSSVNNGFKITDGTTIGILTPSSISTNSLAFGSATSHPLVFITNNVEAGRVTPNRNLLWGTTTNPGPRFVAANGVGTLPIYDTQTVAVFQNNATTSVGAFISAIGGTTGTARLLLGDQDSASVGQLLYDNSDNHMAFVVNGVEAGRFTSTKHLLINQTSDTEEFLQVNGSARFTGTNGYLQISSGGNVVSMSNAAANYITASSTSGRLGFITNGRALTDANANLLLNADQSVTVNTTLLVDSISEKTASAGISFGNKLNPYRSYVASGITSVTVFTALSGWIPNTGDVLLGEGYANNTTIGHQVSIISIYRASSTGMYYVGIDRATGSVVVQVISSSGTNNFSVFRFKSNDDTFTG